MKYVLPIIKKTLFSLVLFEKYYIGNLILHPLASVIPLLTSLYPRKSYLQLFPLHFNRKNCSLFSDEAAIFAQARVWLTDF
jgi:hypothetical protein